MANNIVGSVSAEIILDTKQFEEAIGKLKGEVREIKESFNQKTGGNKGLVDEVKQLKEEIDSLKGKINDYKNTIKNLRETQLNYNQEITRLNKELRNAKNAHSDNVKILKEEQKVLDNDTKSVVKNVEALKKRSILSSKTFRPSSASTSETSSQAVLEGMKNAYYQYDRVVRESAEKEKASWQTRQSAMRNAAEAWVSTTRNMVLEQKKAFASEGGYNNYLNTLSKVSAEFGKVNNADFTKLSNNIYRNGELILSMGESWRKTQADIVNSTTLIKTSFRQVGEEVEVIKTKIGMVSEVLSTFNFKLVEMADRESVAAKRAVELSSAMQRMNTQGTANWQGRQVTGGYSNYISQSGNITQTLKRQAQAVKEVKYATEGLSQAYSKINLNSYKSNISQVNQALEQQRLRTAQLEAAQASLYYKNAPNNLNTYKMNMDQINQSLDRQTGIHKNNTNEIKRGQMSMREFGTTMGKAEAYSNNLYRGLQKVRSVIVSMKTILAAFGGMAVFSFVSDLIDGAKETYNAKSEMESLLNQNNKVSTQGQELFNKELDNTIDKFQKINKYSLGETASSIGLEFDLNAKEMAKSLDVIAMIQSEYARAGRSNEEAALAVKDILQGEFRRLSMETGIGEEELTGKYGWSGEKEDILGLLDALRKAGKDRHWDVFAAKATSVGDIVTITKSRFSEFGADLISTIEPALVSGFNGLIEVLDNVKKAFDGMDSFSKLTTVAGAGGGLFVGISSALMMFKRNMGLADMATIGWGKSFMTAIMGLNKTDVALHGFNKTLLATISGTDAATVSNNGFAKSLVARLLGVNQNKVATMGLSNSLVAHKAALKGESMALSYAELNSMKLSQRLAYLIGDVDLAKAKSLGWAGSLRAVVTSTKLLRIALLGLTSIAILSWFAGVVAYTDKCKKAMDNLNKVASKGAKISENAQEEVDKYTNKLSELTEGTKKYNKVRRQLKIATNNKKDIDAANELLKIHKEDYKTTKESIDERRKSRIDESLRLASDGKKDLPTTNYEFQIEQAIKVRNHALEEYDNRLYSASQHINEQVGIMKQAGISEKKRLDYVREYQVEAENTAQLWKKFHEGDLTSGIYALLSEAKLLWIDLWHNEHFVNFWNSVNKTWTELKPTLDFLVKKLGDLGNILLDFFSTKEGQIVGGVAAVSLAIVGLGWKLKGVIGPIKDTVGGLKDLVKWFKKGGKASKDSETDLPGKDKSTGGINGDIGTTSKVPFKETLKGDVQKYARAAVGIAAGMLLITEAIVLLKAPMAALTELGWQYKQWEPDLRKGIEGLTLIAPVVSALLIPVLALAYVFEKFGVQVSTIVKGAFKAAVGIAAGLLLVAESIAMLIPSIWALGLLGDQYSGMESQVKKGTEAMKLVSDSLQYLLPFVPVLAAGIILGITIFASGPVGLALTGGAFLGVAIGLGLVTEAILGLQAPLWAIGEIGKNFQDLGNVRQGSEAIKLTAEALKYVNEAMISLTGIDLNLLAQNIAKVVSDWLGVDLGGSLTSLTAEDGVIPQLNKFAQDFNKFNFVPIDQEKVSALALAGDGVKTVGDAMVKVKDAMNNLPAEFKNGNTGERLGITGNNTNGTSSTDTVQESQGYFDTFKEPIKQLKEFVDEFNTSDEFNVQPVDTGRIEAISSSADMITQINDAVKKVKTTMGNIGDSQWNTAQAEGGWFSAVGNFLWHPSGEGEGAGDYKSSIGSSLKEMEDVIADLFTFQTNISKYGGEGGEGTDVGGLTNMVTIIQDAIGKVSQSLSDAVPQFKENGHSLSGAIVNGFNEGSANIKSLGSGVVSKIANGIMTNKDMVYNTANSLGKTTATKFKTGVDPMSEYMTWELSYVKQAMTDRYDELGQTAYDLGSHIASRFKEGDDINSPGIMARSMQDEIGYIGQYLEEGAINLPQSAFNLANALSSNFNLDFNLSNIQLPDVTPFLSNLSFIPSTVNTVKTQVSTNFNAMKTNIGGAFTNIVTNTRSSMSRMLSTTTSNIGNIKLSWKGMQDALIASADHIKTQTGQKIDKLKTNLGDFWNKVQHPDQLISGSAGPVFGHQGSIRRRSRPHISVPKGNYAGGFNFKPQKSKGSPSDMKDDYLKCLLSGQECYAGWGFNWTRDIANKFKNWKTHFAKFHLDDYLNVGKFENSNFPVKGNAAVAKAYIYDVISATRYGKYFNSNFGDDPVAALRAGVFNCWDGANIILAIARAFGFNGGMGHGTWNGIGHVWASIPGLGNIDATAIQNGYGFTSPKVKGYAGSINRSRSNNVPDANTTNTNHHEEVHIHIEGPVYGIDDLEKKIEDGAKRVTRKLFTKKLTGV